jgi:PAS domain S-box-containing protein
MGNGASVAADVLLSQPVDESALATRKLSIGVSLLSKNPQARKEFIEFLKSGIWIDDLCSENRLFNDSSPMHKIIHEFNQSEAASSEPVPNEESPETNEIYCDYVLPVGKSRAFVDSRFTTAVPEPQPITTSTSLTIEEKNRDAFIETCFTTPQLKTILLASVFPIFLRNPIYQHWLQNNDNDTHDNAINLDQNSEEAVIGREERLDELFQPRERRLREIVSQALRTVDTEELSTLLATGDWLKNLIATVEDLSLCVSLATARQDRPGFPLVYVNKAFEQTTGYDRSEIVGQNCKFLQSSTSEAGQIVKMRYALGHTLPVKVALTNTREDGTEFFNLLAMKPIFDADGNYAYVIGVQYDITHREASAKEIKLVDDLLSILPNVLQ